MNTIERAFYWLVIETVVLAIAAGIVLGAMIWWRP